MPSLLNADLARLGQEVAAMETAGADGIHWDVMDGTFVPNLTFGPDVVAATRAHSLLRFDAHLMVADPDLMLARWVDAGCATVIVHVESTVHLHRTLTAIGELGAAAGVALNPATPAESVAEVLDLVDLVLVMSVNPGFGGQRYIPAVERKIRRLRSLIDTSGRDVELQVDGGIAAATVRSAWEAGANSFVSGSAVFRHREGPSSAISELKELCSGERLAASGV